MDFYGIEYFSRRDKVAIGCSHCSPNREHRLISSYGLCQSLEPTVEVVQVASVWLASVSHKPVIQFRGSRVSLHNRTVLDECVVLN